MIATDPNLRSHVRFFRSATRRAQALFPDLCRGIGIAMGAVVVLSFLAAVAFQPFLHA